MKQAHPNHLLIPDYLSGSLSSSQQQAFEAALENDATLRQAVVQERKVQQSINAPGKPLPQFSFDALSARIDGRPVSKPKKSRYSLAAAAFASFAFVAISVTALIDSTPQNNQFTTLTSNNAVANGQLRLILSNNNSDISGLLNDFGLELIHHYEQANVVDVKPANTAAAELVEALKQDPRVQTVSQAAP